MTANVRFKLWSGTKDDGEGVFLCPGCNTEHVIALPEPHQWNGNVDHVTLTPSVIASWRGKISEGSPKRICHSFVTDGKIRFLNDCTHALVGQTVELPPYRNFRDGERA